MGEARIGAPLGLVGPPGETQPSRCGQGSELLGEQKGLSVPPCAHLDFSHQVA